jgi:hypothetical protein
VTIDHLVVPSALTAVERMVGLVVATRHVGAAKLVSFVGRKPFTIQRVNGSGPFGS